MNSWLLVTLDSCRFDTFLKADMRALQRRIGARHVERRYSHATWTAPSHYAILSGLLPHHAEPEDTAGTPDLYRGELRRHCELLGISPDRMRERFPPGLWLPEWLQAEGYATFGSVALPVIGPRTVVGRHGWSSFNKTRSHNDIREHVEALTEFVLSPAAEGRPWFAMINVGETHYPYTAAGQEGPPDAPHLSGLNGAARSVLGHVDSARPTWLTEQRLAAFRRMQVEACKSIEDKLIELVDLAPKGARVTITADHGEAFGEGGWFGHGPVAHKIVLEVPFLEGTA